MKDYIRFKLNDFEKEHAVLNTSNIYDGDIKRQWKNDSEEIHGSWKDINSISDVYSYIDSYVYSVEREGNLKTLCLDTYDTDLALYRAIYAIEKAVCCFDNKDLDFNTLDKESIDILFTKLNNAYKKMQDIIMRRTMYD